ncbi:Lanosterol 14-alpha-demethylase [Physocladia obscura]|uniref:Lanosterol 14-alpha-demethylase n=1 Tax=Physocladia obscura TaxID=109957 RepID=A0AAD5SZP6_9FUNG|nr:Lanosterol 14-alpha-demethylase [Physocladia obscura]
MGVIDSAITSAVRQAIDWYAASKEFGLPYAISALAVLIVVVFWSVSAWSNAANTGKNLPPTVKYTLPFFGNTIEYGIDPVKFLQKCQKEYGDTFTFLMLGRMMTFTLGPDGNHFLFNVKLKDATAEGAYETLTVPVFGKEVVYDVPNSLFMEQKKFVKDALSTAAFKSYLPIITYEVKDYLDSVFENLKAGQETYIETFQTMSELTIRTAAHCLMGKEIRDGLRVGSVTKLYHDLDAGFRPINVFFRWLPLPAYFARDKANLEMTNLFKTIMKKRKAENDTETLDVLNGLMRAEYKDGSKPSDDAIAHLMIALLLGGQHTSSTTSSWILFELARRPDVVADLLEEQSMVLTGKPDTPPHLLPDLDYESLKKLTLMDCVMKESLRLHTPIHTIMRFVENDVEYKGLIIPKGHFVCAAPQVSHLTESKFPEPYKFDPLRHLGSDEGSGEWTINGVDIAQKSARSLFLPFGAGNVI